VIHFTVVGFVIALCGSYDFKAAGNSHAAVLCCPLDGVWRSPCPPPTRGVISTLHGW
jgi:hypothetical protein